MPQPDHLMQEAQSLLHQHGLAAATLEPTAGFANAVLQTPTHIIRLNGGRFRHAFRHEATVLAHLPATIPHPTVTAIGTRVTEGEYLILERLPGTSLDLAWPHLTTAERTSIAAQLGNHLKTLHALPPEPWMTNPWVEDTLATHRWADGYHLPVSTTMAMLHSARQQRPDLTDLLENLAAFLAPRLAAHRDDRSGFLHTDIHFRNIMVHEGRISGLIDFEGSRPGPIDVELDMLLRYLTDATPSLGLDIPAFLAPLHETYPQLFAAPNLLTRLEVYEAQWHLVQLHHWQPGATWTADPAIPLRTLLAGIFAQQISALAIP